MIPILRRNLIILLNIFRDQDRMNIKIIAGLRILPNEIDDNYNLDLK